MRPGHQEAPAAHYGPAHSFDFAFLPRPCLSDSCFEGETFPGQDLVSQSLAYNLTGNLHKPPAVPDPSGIESERLLELSIHVPSARRALIDYDDKIGGGVRNQVKRWWFDLEIVAGICVHPRGVNERELDLGRGGKLAKEQKLAFFPPSLQPAGGLTTATVVPLDRSAGQKAYAQAERPIAARKRRDAI